MEDGNQPLLTNASGDDSLSTIVNPKTSSIGNQDDIVPFNGISHFLKGFFIESRKLWLLAAPVMFITICQYSVTAVTQVFAGQLGTIQLAAISVENFVISGYATGIMMGMGSALDTLCGQAYGANQFHMLGIYMQRSWLVLNIAAFASVFLFIFSTPILKLLGQTAEISEAAGKFSLWMIPQQFAYASKFPVAKFLLAQSKVMGMAVIAAVTLGLHAFFSWFLMLKMRWGLVGAALTLNASWWFMAVAQFLYAISGSCDQAWSGFSLKAFQNLWGFIRLSVSSAFMLCLEIWYNMALTLCAGHLIAAEVSVDAFSICLNIVNWASMLAMALNAAVSVRVSNELGSRRPRSAKFAIIVAGVISLLIGVLLALILIINQEKYAQIFSSSEEVRQIVQELTPLLAVSIVFSNLQYTISGVAVGAGWQTSVAYMNAGCYFLLGVPLGILLGYKLDMGVKGLLYGMVSGICSRAFLLVSLIIVTNWNKETNIAEDRMKQWGGTTDVEEPYSER